MTTYHVDRRGHLKFTAHDKALRESLAATVKDGQAVPVERALTAGELMAAERREMAA